MLNMLPFIRPWMVWNGCFLFSAFIASPYNPRFALYIVEPLGLAAQGLCGIFEAHTCLQMTSMCAFYWTFFFGVFTLIVNNWLTTIAEDYSVVLQPWQRTRALKSYRVLQVLNNMYNDCMSSLVWPSFVLCNVMCHTMCVCVSVGLVRNFSLDVASVYPTWTLIWLFQDFTVFPFVAKTGQKSMKFKKLWEGKRLNKFERKTLLSLKPLEVKVGEYYSIGKTTGVTIAGIVSSLSANALMLHNIQ